MYKTTVVCCFNDDMILESMLKKGLMNQKNIHLQMIFIRCDDGQFTSAASAFNQNLKKIENDYVFFIHQDLFLDDPYLLANCCKFLDDNQNSIVGLIGTMKQKVFSNMFHGLRGVNLGEAMSAPIEVNALDEVFMGLKKDMLVETCFDEKTVDNWHFYVVDYCYERSTFYGTKVFVLPYKSIHKNNLEWKNYVRKYCILPVEYQKTANNVRIKYHKVHKCIYTCCFCFHTNFIIFAFEMTKLKLRMFLKRKIRNIDLKGLW